MAENKKSFLLYCDLIHTVNKMPDEKAGQLLKHILSYVNDENPKTDDLIIQLTFEPIRQQLKRDLSKYETIREKNANNARKRWNATASERMPNDAKNADNDNDNVNDTVTDNDNVNVSKDNITPSAKKFDFKKALIDFGVTESTASDWMLVRSKKRSSNTETAFKLIAAEIQKSGLPAEKCISEAVAGSWQGFKSHWLHNLKSNIGAKPSINHSSSPDKYQK